MANTPSVPSNWALVNSPLLVQASTYLRFVHNSVTTFVAATALSAAVVAGTATQTIATTTIFHDDPCGRIVTLVFTPNSATSRNVSVTVNGLGQYGQTINEVVTWTQAAGAPRAYFTRNAFIAVTSITVNSITAGNMADTLSAGIVLTAATAGTAGTQTNGASATHFKGFGLPIQPKTQLSAATITTTAACEVRGMSIKHGIAATADWVYATPLSRAGDFLIDAQYGIMVPDEDPVAVATDGSAAPADDAVVGFLLHVQTNRGE